MSDLEQREGTDVPLKTGASQPVTNESVITAPEQLASISNKGDAVNYPLSNIDLVDAKQEPTEGGRYEPPFQNLRYDYMEDPLQTGIGKVTMAFDSITNKMSKLLGKPEIENQHAFSMQSLKDAIEHPELSKHFSETEIQALRLMANQARRLIDPTRIPQIDAKAIREGKLPMDQIYISRASVDNAGRKLGVLKDA